MLDKERYMTFDEYQKKALATAIDEGSELEQRVLGLMGESGEIADKIKKWYRDDKANPEKLPKQELAAELGDILWYIATLADYLGYGLQEIAAANVQKLEDRKNRDKLSGSGDKR
jgi:NTP pyrophosphatase (non-canonical NTP hydrolase)